MKFIPILSITVALVIAGPSYGAPELTPHIAEYEVRMSVISGVLSKELRKTPNGYIAHHIVKPSGLSRMITQGTMDLTSEFQNGVDGIKPIRFQAIDTIRGQSRCRPDIRLEHQSGPRNCWREIGGIAVERHCA